MTQVIAGIIIFTLGALFGVGWMCLLSAGKHADEEMQDFQEVNSHEQ